MSNTITITLAPKAEEPRGAFEPIIGESLSGLLQSLVDSRVIPPDTVPKVQSEAIRILSQCVPPNERRASRVGLVCGYVQSGKTLSIESVAALAKDNGYRLIILMAGVTTNLLDQSTSRMEDELRAGAGGYDWNIFENPTLEDRQHLEGHLQYWKHAQGTLASSRMLFVTVMKNHRRLDALSELLEALPLADVPCILIDDEADQASLNTRPLQPNPSPTYLCIERLRRALPHHALLQYTATPQAPLLISRIDSLSADFADIVEPGQGYAGGREFFGQRRQELVRDIPTTEVFDHNNLPQEPPESLLEALRMFFVGVAAVPKHEHKGHRSMLVHPHQRREVHERFLSWIDQLQKDWYRTLSNAGDPDRGELLREFELAYEDLLKSAAQLPDFATIIERLPDALNRVVLTKVNSDNGREIRWSNGYAHILVGGEKLGRGYTVKGLTVTYMPRSPGGFNADTIQQRARFFGYHDKPGSSYLSLCRVFLHPMVAQVFTDYVAHEEDLRAQIDEHRGRSLKDLKRAFILDAAIRPTRHNIMRRLYERPRLSSGWLEQRAPHAASGGDNVRLAQALRSRIAFTPDQSFPRHLYADLELDSVLHHFLVSFETPDDRDAMPMMAVLMTLAEAVKENPGATCRVYFMDADAAYPRERTLGQSDSEIDLMQGRSSATGPNRYPGDRAFLASNRVTVQVHRLRIVRTVGNASQTVVPETIALAIHLPSALSANVTDTIVQPQH